MSSNSNIKRVILISVVGDNVAGMAGKSTSEQIGVGQDLIKQGNKHPHLQFSEDPETRRLIAYALKFLGIQ